MTEDVRQAAKAIFRGLAVRFEGRRRRPYLCPAGIPTIGIGATAYEDGRKVTLKDKPITDARMDELFEVTGAVYMRAVLKLSPILAAEPARLAAIADFAFNLGVARYKASTLRRKVNAGDWPAAQRELRKWVWGGGRKLPGLVKRRAVEAALLAAPEAAQTETRAQA